jgi:hypothetical protein
MIVEASKIQFKMLRKYELASLKEGVNHMLKEYEEHRSAVTFKAIQENFRLLLNKDGN